MRVDITQTCNYNIHSYCTVRAKFLRREINKSLIFYQLLNAWSCYYIVMLLFTRADYKVTVGMGLDVHESHTASVLMILFHFLHKERKNDLMLQ